MFSFFYAVVSFTEKIIYEISKMYNSNLWVDKIKKKLIRERKKKVDY